MLRYSALVYFAFATALHAQSVFVNSHIIATPTGPPFPPRFIFFHFSQSGLYPPTFPAPNPHPCNPVYCESEAGFEYDGARIKGFVFSADGGSDWFLVRPGDTFSRATINAGQFPTIANALPPPLGGEVTVGSGEFYLGVSTGMWVGADLRSRTAYGWVHLRPVDGVLTMVENVMSYNSPGIIVGTTTIVPEPATWVAIAGLAFVCRRRRN